MVWQRCFHLARTYRTAGGTLPHRPGQLTVQGEDIGRWVQAQRTQWGTLTTVQQWLLTEILGITAAPGEKPNASRSVARPHIGVGTGQRLTQAALPHFRRIRLTQHA
ncbi:helicase associated domain-containing protein [Streptomyces sp. NPDC059718]